MKDLVCRRIIFEASYVTKHGKMILGDCDWNSFQVDVFSDAVHPPFPWTSSASIWPTMVLLCTRGLCCSRWSHASRHPWWSINTSCGGLPAFASPRDVSSMFLLHREQLRHVHVDLEIKGYPFILPVLCPPYGVCLMIGCFLSTRGFQLIPQCPA